MKKLKKSLSVLLTLVMLFTTLCFFVPELGTTALAATTTEAGYSIVVPETIYLTPSTSPSTVGQYYVNNNKDGTVKAAYAEEGEFYINYPGATQLESVTATNSSGAAVTVNWSSFTPKELTGETIEGKATITLPTGVSAGNCELIEWTFVFTVGGETKTHHAYSVAYSPWYTPVGAATRAKSHDLFATSMVWVSGVHGYTANTAADTYWIAATNETKTNDSQKKEDYTGVYYPKLSNSAFVPLITGVADADNTSKNFNNWLSKSYSAGTTVEDATFRGFSYEAGTWDYGCFVADISPVANMTVDVSRYSNFNQIPNFTIGFNATDVADNNSTYWYISDFTSLANSATNATNAPKFYNWTKSESADYMSEGDNDNVAPEKEWFNNGAEGDIITGSATGTSPVVNGCEYNGTWNRAIENKTSSYYDYVVKGALHTYRKKSGTTKKARAYSVNYAQLRVTNADKSALRTLVERGATLAQENYTSDTWNAYIAELKAAALRLGNPTSSDVTTAALTAKESALQTTVYFNGNGGTASATSAPVTIGANTTANYAPTATASRNGYTFKGWSTDKNATTASSTLTLGFNQTVYAVWEGNPQTLTLDLDGGSYAGNLIYSPKGQSSMSGGGSTITYNIAMGADGVDISGNYSIAVGKAEATVNLPIWVYLEKGKTYEFSFTSNYDRIQYFFFRGNEENTSSSVGEHAATANANNPTFTGLTKNADGSSTYKGTFVCGGNGDLAENSWANAADATCFYQMRIDCDLASAATEAVSGSYWVKGLAVKAVDADTTVKFVHPTDSTLAIANPTKTDYTFKGWSLNGSTTATGYTYKFAIGGNTLTAQWQDANYYIAFDANSGSGSMSTIKANIGENCTLTANAFTKTGYHFLGWSLDKSATAETYGDKAAVQLATKVSTVTLYAVWAKNDYTVNYVGGDGATGNVQPQSAKYDEIVTLRANGFSKPGYNFVGWSDGNTTYNAGADVENLTATNGGTVTLTAVWKPITYTINFVIAGATIDPITVTYDENAGRLPDGSSFNKPGYTFGGWVDTGSTMAVTNDNYDTLVTVDGGIISLTAVENENSYTIVYDANGGEGTTASQNVKYTDTVTLNANGFTRTGYVFEGWALTAGGSVKYADKTANLSKLTTESNGTVTLYAVWKANTYRVTFYKNDANASGEMNAQSFTYDKKQALSENAFTKEGWHFVGWSTTKGGAVAYNDKQEVSNLTSDVNGNIDLYAQWEINEYEVTFVFYNATGEKQTVTVDAKHGEAFNTLIPEAFTPYYYTSDTTKDGVHYEFSAWENAVETITENATFTAQYKSEQHAFSPILSENKAATCTEKGLEAKRCTECDYEYRLELDTIDHNWVLTSTTATCTTDGETKYLCSVCKGTKSENVSALGHTFGDTTAYKAATCTEKGNNAYKQCTVCKNYFADTADKFATDGKADTSSFEITALGHKYDETKGVSLDNGKHTVTCTVCEEGTEGHTKEVECTYGTPVVTEPTCTKGGYTTYTCSICSYSYNADETEANGHTYGAWKSNGDGTHTKTCTACTDEDGRTVTVDCTNFSAETIETAATCTTDGLAKYTCTDCSAEFTRTIDKTGHKFVDDVEKVEATCTADGNEAYKKCENCGLYFAASEEKYSENGKTDVSAFTINKTGHDFDTTVEAKTATCTEDGNNAYKHCKNCDLYFEAVADTDSTDGVDSADTFVRTAAGHNFETTAAKTPDCTNGGNVEYKYCDVCHKYFAADAENYATDGADTNETFLLEAKGHTEATRQIHVNNASCTVAGSYDVETYCTVCDVRIGELEHKDGVMLPHTYTEQIIDEAHLKTAATCTTYAVYYYDCVNCTANSKDDVTPVTFEYVDGGFDSTNHSTTETYLDGDKAATCKDTGYTGDYRCKDCNAVVTAGSEISVNPANHAGGTKVEKENVVPGTCTTEETWNDVTYCLGCGNKLKTEPKTGEKNADNHVGGTKVEKEDVVPGTCKTEETWNDVTYCLGCGNKLNTEPKTGEKNADNHVGGTKVEKEDVVPGTCTTAETWNDVTYCLGCGNKLNTEPKTGEKDSANHVGGTKVEKEDVVPGTCKTEETWNDVTYCLGCGNKLNTEPKTGEKNADNHVGGTKVEKEDVVPGTCKTEKTWNDVTYCLGCGNKLNTEPKTGEKDSANHVGETKVEKENVVPGTCIAAETWNDVTYCLGCNQPTKTEPKTGELNANNHVGGTRTVVENKVPATATTKGSYDEVVYCMSCNKEISRTPKTYSASDVLPNLPEDGKITVDMGEDGKSTDSLDDILGGDGNNDYTSSNPDVNVDEDGKITADNDGETTITVTTPDGETIDITVTVRTLKTIKFVMKDKTETVKAYNGDAITAPAVADYTGTNGFIYKFKNWDKTVTKVNGNATYTAQYTEPCDYTDLDSLEETLNEILDGSLADESVINANRDEIDKVLEQIENINKDRNTRDKDEQATVDYVSNSIRDLIDVIYPDAGSELVITGAAVHYVGTILNLNAVKMPVGTTLTDVEWTSSDDNVVFCSNGKLYAIGTGTVTITATRGILKASKTITIVEGGNIRGINFTSINNTHFIIEDYFAVYNSAILYWSDDCDLRFRVRVYQSFMFEDYIIYINGQEVEPDADGYYTVPAGSGDVRVTIAGAIIDTGAGSGGTVTKWSFWEWLLNLFRKIINFFKNLGN